MNAILARAVAVLTVGAGAAVLVGPHPLAVAGGLMLAFVLPGLALVAVFFRGRELRQVEWIVLAPALSMGLLIVAGLGTYAIGLRIDRLTWTVATVGVTLAALAGARLRPRRPQPAGEQTAGAPKPGAQEAGPQEAGPQEAGERQTGEQPVGEQTARLPAPGVAEAATVVMSVVPPLEDDPHQVRGQRRRLVRQLLPLVAVAAVLAGASWLSFDTSRSTQDEAVTALSAKPSELVDVNGNRVVQVSASGLLTIEGPYTITVVGTARTAVARRTVVPSGDGAWSEQLSLPAAQRLTVRLFRWGDTTAYRTLYISAVD